MTQSQNSSKYFAMFTMYNEQVRKLSSIFIHVYILLRINSYHAEINKIKNYFNVTKNKCVVISCGMVNVVNAADLLIEHTKTLNKIDLI